MLGAGRMPSAGADDVLVGDLAAAVDSAAAPQPPCHLREIAVLGRERFAVLPPADGDGGFPIEQQTGVLDRRREARDVTGLGHVRFVEAADRHLRARAAANPAGAA
jgi:hypothetical protein